MKILALISALCTGMAVANTQKIPAKLTGELIHHSVSSSAVELSINSLDECKSDDPSVVKCLVTDGKVNIAGKEFVIEKMTTFQSSYFGKNKSFHFSGKLNFGKAALEVPFALTVILNPKGEAVNAHLRSQILGNSEQILIEQVSVEEK